MTNSVALDTQTHNQKELLEMAGTLRLKGAALLELGLRAENAHQLALRSRTSYGTVNKYVTRPEEMISIDLSSLTRILVYGLEIDPAKLLEMKLGDLFEYVP